MGEGMCFDVGWVGREYVSRKGKNIIQTFCMKNLKTRPTPTPKKKKKKKKGLT